MSLSPRASSAADGPGADIVARLRAASADGQSGVREEMKRLVSDPVALIGMLGEPERGGITTLHNDSALTILQIVWSPLMILGPHDHNMWATVGVYGGREDNIYWKRHGQAIEAAGAKSLGVGDVASMGSDGVHSVVNPVAKLTATLHVYGGDFFAPGRTSWTGEDHRPREFDQDEVARNFQDSNARFGL